MADSAPANGEGGTPGTTSSLPSAPSDLIIADMEQCIERITAEYSIWRDADISQHLVLREARLKALDEEENAATATKRAMEALQQQKDILDSARAKVDALNMLVQIQDLRRERAKEVAAEIQAMKARIDEARKQVAGHDASSTGKCA